MTTHTPIPNKSEVINERGLISHAWHQFLNKIFGDIYKKLDALETARVDHEARIAALEP